MIGIASSIKLSMNSNDVLASAPPVEFVRLPLISEPGITSDIPNSGFIPTVTVCGSRTSLPFCRLAVTSYSPGTSPVW